MAHAGHARVRAGVVGTGHMGQYHALVYAEMPDVDLAGVVDIDGDRAAGVARRYETQAFGDHRDLIGRVDIVSVAVPTEQHFHVARDLLEAGVSVLVEKPMTPTLEEARELFAIARRTGAAVQVGHVERFNRAVDEMRLLVRQPILVESRRLGPFVPRAQKDTVVMDLMIHDIDIVLGLVDSPPVRVAAQGISVHSEVADVASVQVRFESGAIATITASRATEEKVRTLTVTQPDAYIVLDYTEQDIQIFRRASHEFTTSRRAIRYQRRSQVDRIKLYMENPLKLELQHLIEAMRRERAGEHDGLAEREDLRSLAMALEIERMIRDGVPEVVWPRDLPWSAASP
jgi:predicted dehydrogenase